jgi:hypothetical protein
MRLRRVGAFRVRKSAHPWNAVLQSSAGALGTAGKTRSVFLLIWVESFQDPKYRSFPWIFFAQEPLPWEKSGKVFQRLLA